MLINTVSIYLSTYSFFFSVSSVGHVMALISISLDPEFIGNDFERDDFEADVNLTGIA